MPQRTSTDFFHGLFYQAVPRTFFIRTFFSEKKRMLQIFCSADFFAPRTFLLYVQTLLKFLSDRAHMKKRKSTFKLTTSCRKMVTRQPAPVQRHHNRGYESQRNFAASLNKQFQDYKHELEAAFIDREDFLRQQHAVEKSQMINDQARRMTNLHQGCVGRLVINRQRSLNLLQKIGVAVAAQSATPPQCASAVLFGDPFSPSHIDMLMKDLASSIDYSVHEWLQRNFNSVRFDVEFMELRTMLVTDMATQAIKTMLCKRKEYPPHPSAEQLLFTRLFDEYDETVDDNKLDMRSFSERLVHFLQTNKTNNEAMDKFKLLCGSEITKPASPRSVASKYLLPEVANVVSIATLKRPITLPAPLRRSLRYKK